MNSISVIIISKNEEANIRRCLESLRWANEIIVLDSGSQDNTVTIAKEFTQHVYDRRDWQGYGIQKQRALCLATQEWVLNIDADETVTPQLQQEILEKIQDPEADAFRIPICMNFYDEPLRYSYSPKRHIRLFKREIAHYSEDIVHEKIILQPQARIKQLSSGLMHQSFQDVSHALYKINRYSSYTAKQRLENKEALPSLIKILLGTTWMFFRCFLLQRGFLEGRAGFIMAVFNAQGTFYRGIKQIYPDKQTSDLQ